MKRLILFLMLAAPVFGQGLPDKPQPTVKVQLTCKGNVICAERYHVNPAQNFYQELPVPHRTADRAFILDTLLSFGMTAADVENSIYALNKPGTEEANFVFGSHPSRGKYYAIVMPIAGLNAAFSYHYKREDDALKAAGLIGHKYAKWWVPNLINTIGHGIGVAVTASSTGR